MKQIKKSFNLFVVRKVLFVANIHKHFKAFHIPYILYLKDLGYEVHVAANGTDTIIGEADKQFFLPLDRSPFSSSNMIAIRRLRRIIESENYCLVHCHTAMGSVVARIASLKFRRKGFLKVIYTAHGFHFYKGSPLQFWLLYFPMEFLLARFTDAIITLNEEDFSVVNSSFFPKVRSFKIPGIGINTQKFTGISGINKQIYREKNGYAADAFIVLYVAEFINRKNHSFIVESVVALREFIPGLRILFAGRGQLLEHIKESVSQNHIDKYVDFLGFRTDIGEVIMLSDVVVSASRQEGLPMNVAEALFAGKPVVASKIRGHEDLISHGKNGFLYDQGNSKQFINYIRELYNNKALYDSTASSAAESARSYLLSECLEQMGTIYKKFL